jgi:hypothetical protein
MATKKKKEILTLQDALDDLNAELDRKFQRNLELVMAFFKRKEAERRSKGARKKRVKK